MFACPCFLWGFCMCSSKPKTTRDVLKNTHLSIPLKKILYVFKPRPPFCCRAVFSLPSVFLIVLVLVFLPGLSRITRGMFFVFVLGYSSLWTNVNFKSMNNHFDLFSHVFTISVLKHRCVCVKMDSQAHQALRWGLYIFIYVFNICTLIGTGGK